MVAVAEPDVFRHAIGCERGPPAEANRQEAIVDHRRDERLFVQARVVRLNEDLDDCHRAFAHGDQRLHAIPEQRGHECRGRQTRHRDRVFDIRGISHRVCECGIVQPHYHPLIWVFFAHEQRDFEVHQLGFRTGDHAACGVGAGLPKHFGDRGIADDNGHAHPPHRCRKRVVVHRFNGHHRVSELDEFFDATVADVAQPDDDNVPAIGYFPHLECPTEPRANEVLRDDCGEHRQ